MPYWKVSKRRESLGEAAVEVSRRKVITVEEEEKALFEKAMPKPMIILRRKEMYRSTDKKGVA